MKSERKAARDKLNSIKTRAELESYLSDLNLTDDEMEISRYIFGRGWSLTHISLEMGLSINQLRKRIAKIYDKML